MKLKKWLKQNKVEPVDFAKYIDMAKSTVYHWINGTRHPTRRAKLQIAEVTKNEVTFEDWEK